MIDYVASFTNTNTLAFPDTLTVNASGPSTTDGTELIKLFGDDIWGRFQAVLDHAGLTPDGVTEAPGTSQHVEALQLGFGGSPGFVQEWNLASTPAVTGHRCLFLQGQGILHANYAELTSAVYVGDGNNAAVAAGGGFYYKATDAAGTTPNIAGTYLILPDARGVVARGLDAAASIDPDGASRFLGDVQIDAFQGWQAGMDESSDAVAGPYYGVGSLDGTTTQSTAGVNTARPFYEKASQGLSSMIIAQDDGTNGTPRIDTETRMYNRSTHFVIWY